MDQSRMPWSAAVLGSLLCTGLILLGYALSHAVLQVKALERTVEVKGLSERDVPADLAIWPITFNEAGNDLGVLYQNIQNKNQLIIRFLAENGFDASEISIASPSVTDKQAQQYGGQEKVVYRYVGQSTVTVYTNKVDAVKKSKDKLLELGKQGVAIAGDNYQNQTRFIYSKLNDIKPAMIEEATKNARKTAMKFAKDSDSSLGKIRHANQGLFSVEDRDRSTPEIKKVRVVSTVEYYLVD